MKGALKTFFSQVEEALDMIPAQARVLEYWQEKAVFESDNGEQQVIGARRQSRPLAKVQSELEHSSKLTRYGPPVFNREPRHRPVFDQLCQ